MKKTAVPSILSFKKIPFIFLAILIFCHSSIIYAGENEQYCKDLLSNIIIKKVAINKDKNEKAIKSFWQNKNGTFLGARYYKISKTKFIGYNKVIFGSSLVEKSNLRN